MIIDTHVHVYPPEIRDDRERISRLDPYFDALVHNAVHRWGDADELLSAMDEDGIDESWICGFAFADIGLCRICNDYVLDAAARSGGRLRALAVVPPLARGMFEEVERCVAAGAIGVGELFPEGQGFNVDDYRETWHIVQACHEAEIFLMLHTAEPVGHPYAGKGNIGPAEAVRFCIDHPELDIVLAHWGGGLFFYEQMPELRMQLRKVRYDCTATPYLYEASMFDAALASGVWDKILYGSDWPLLRYPRYQKLLNATKISENDKANLLSGNALTLLGAKGSRGNENVQG